MLASAIETRSGGSPASEAELLQKLCLYLCELSILMSLGCAAASVEEAGHFRGCLQPLQEVGLVQELLEACRLLGILRQGRCCLAACRKTADASSLRQACRLLGILRHHCCPFAACYERADAPSL